MPTYHDNQIVLPTNDRMYVNSEIKGNVNNVQGTFDHTFSEPFLKNPDEYYATISRFSISGQNIPLKIWNCNNDDLYAYAPYANNFDLVVEGQAGGALVNGSTSLTSNWVSFAAIGDSLDYITALNNKDSQKGCIRFSVRQPSGSPTIPRYFYYESINSGADANEISISHLPSGQIHIIVKDSAGVDLINTDVFNFNPVLNQPYEFEFNYDLTNGFQTLYLDGNLESSFSAKGTRSNVDLLRLGSDLTLGSEAGFELNYLTIFREVQHLGNKIPYGNPLAQGCRTNYVMSVTKSGVTNQAYVYYNNANATAPSSYNKNNKYFWDYSYESILNSFNTTLGVLHNSLSGVGSNAPFFRLDNNTLNLVIPYVYFTGEVEVGSDLFTYNLFSTFSGYKSNSDFKFTNYYDLKNNYKIWGEDETALPTYIFLKERGNNWFNKITSFRSIVFTSQNLPIRREKVSRPDNPNGFRQIITDFYPDFNNLADFRQDMTFSSIGNYKLINLQSNIISYTLDWTVNWVDEDGDFHIITLDENCSANVKFGFFKRETFTS